MMEISSETEAHYRQDIGKTRRLGVSVEALLEQYERTHCCLRSPAPVQPERLTLSSPALRVSKLVLCGRCPSSLYG
jgi:hypothetical protein